MSASSAGDFNVAIGTATLEENTGNKNVAIGYGSLENLETGHRNVAVGDATLNSTLNGSFNTALGSTAGPSGSVNYTIALGFGARPTVSNTARIGDTSITQIGGYASFVNLSDARFKTDVKGNVPGLDFVMKLRPVTYQLDVLKLDEFLGVGEPVCDELCAAKQAKMQQRFTGFVAQEVELAAKASGFDFSGVVPPANEHSHYGLAYSEFVVPLVKAVQEQQLLIERQERRIDELTRAVAGAQAMPVSERFASLLGGANEHWLVVGLLGWLFVRGRRAQRGAQREARS